MRQILCVARREYLATVKTKGFILGLLVAPLLMFGAILVLVLVKDLKDTRDRHLAVLDRSGRFGAVLQQAAEKRNSNSVYHPRSGKKIAPAYLIELVKPDEGNLTAQRLALSERVQRGELRAFVEIAPDVLQAGGDEQVPRISYHSPGAAIDDTRSWLAQPINDELRRARLAEVGIQEAQVPRLFEWVEVAPMSLVSVETGTGEIKGAERRDPGQAVIGPVVLTVVMYMMLLMSALPMLNVVMEEKTQRIAEVLLGAARPFPLMAGKMVSALAVALTGAAVYLGLGIGSGLPLAALAYVPWGLLPWFLAYLVPAILMYASLSAALGSACSDPKDAQNLTFPVMLPAILPMFFIGPILREPQSGLSVALSFFPPFTPTLMLMRLGLPQGAPWWQGVLAWALLMVFALVTIWGASRVFRVGFLTMGQSPKLRDLVRWAWRG